MPEAPKARTSFIVRDTKNEKSQPSRRITISETSVEEDLDDIMISRMRKSFKQMEQPVVKRNKQAGFLKK